MPRHSKIVLIIYLAALAAFAPFSTDIYLASMPIIKHNFSTSIENIQLTLSLFFIAFALGQLFWGPLSDRIGRKNIIFYGLCIYIIASFLCAWSQTISSLIMARIIQAIGACSGVVAAFSIVKDTFTEQKEMSKILSGMTIVMMVAPMVAPIIGSYLLAHFHWQANFYALAIYGLILLTATIFVKESYPKVIRKPLPVNTLFHAYFEQLRYTPFLFAAIAVGTNFSILFSFISSSPFIYIKIYHLPTHYFGYFFAFNASALILGSLLLHAIKHRISSRKTIFIGISIAIIGSIAMVLSLLIQPNLMISVVIPSFIVTCGVGILYPELTSYGLKNVVSYTGLASSLLGTFRFTFAAITGYLMGILLNHSALPLAMMMLALSILTLGTMKFLHK